MLIWVRVDGDYHIMEQDGDHTIAIVPDGEGAEKLATAICALPELVEVCQNVEFWADSKLCTDAFYFTENELPLFLWVAEINAKVDGNEI